MFLRHYSKTVEESDLWEKTITGDKKVDISVQWGPDTKRHRP